MYIEKLKLTNFRKFDNIKVRFNKGLNLFVGPNDSGKTTIIDALKLVLGTASNDYFKIQESDFYNTSNIFKIEAFITDFTVFQISQLLDWGGLNSSGKFCLKVIFESSKTSNGFHTTIKAGTYEEDDGGSYLEPIVKDYIRSVYLKPLRNAEVELSAGNKSRFSQILLAHPDIKKTNPTDSHLLEEKFKEFKNNELTPYFDSKNIKTDINNIFEKLLEKNKGIKGDITINSSSIEEIVKSLSLLIEDSNNGKSGLGTSNLLLIASELLLLEKLKGDMLGCALIEEIEAHIHPQGQLRLINFLEEKSSNLQLFLTSHSPNIASKLDISNIFIFRDDKIFPMSENYSALSEEDYKHLRRFLDVTKANLFFAKGLIFVEGIAEALIIPEIAKILGYDLDSYGISIINVNGLSFNRYINAFIRKKGSEFDIKISTITDRDFKGKIFSFPKKDSVLLKTLSNPKYILEKENKKKKKYYIFDKELYIDDLINNEELDTVYCDSIVEKISNSIYKYYSKIQTLEFDMGLSCLGEKLLEARVKLGIDEDDYDDIITETNKYKKASKLYKKIEKKKGETAQELALILSNLSNADKITLKGEIEQDIYLKYIVEAIKNVTE